MSEPEDSGPRDDFDLFPDVSGDREAEDSDLSVSSIGRFFPRGEKTEGVQPKEIGDTAPAHGASETGKPPFVPKQSAIPAANKQEEPTARSAGTGNTRPTTRERPPAIERSSGSRLRWLPVLSWLVIAALVYLILKHSHAPVDTTGSLPGEHSQIGDLEAQVADLSTRIAELEGMRELQQIGNQAIANGDRSALLKLGEFFKDPKIESLRETANAEIVRIESYYITTRPYRGIPRLDQMPPISVDDPVGSLSRMMLDDSQHWAIRARAATLLGEHRKIAAAAEALAESCLTETNLYVLHEAILAFAEVTGFPSTGIFDSSSVSQWWEDNRDSFNGN